jgi:outer membrane protein assembly factor BamB
VIAFPLPSTPAAATPLPISIRQSGDPSTAVAYQITAAHEGTSTTPLTLPLTRTWISTFPAGTSLSYPVIANDTVFVCASTTTGMWLGAVRLADGSTLWTQQLGTDHPPTGPALDGRSVFTFSADGELRAFDAATGDPLWTRDMRTPQIYAFSSPPTASGGVVYVDGSGIGGEVFAIDEATGDDLWSASVFAADHAPPAVTPSGVVVTPTLHAYAFDPSDGRMVWSHTSPGVWSGGRTPVVTGGRVFVRDPSPSVAGTVYDGSTGRTLSTFEDDGPAPVVVGPDLHQLIPSQSTLYQVDMRTNTTNWRFKHANMVTAPLAVGSWIFEGTSSGTLLAIDAASGTLAWSDYTGYPIAETDESGTSMLAGVAAADSMIVVPETNVLVAYGD